MIAVKKTKRASRTKTQKIKTDPPDVLPSVENCQAESPKRDYPDGA